MKPSYRCYIIDTSALIDLNEWYPRETFPSIWKGLETLAGESELKCPREVMRELERKSVEIMNWIKNSGMVISDAASMKIIPEAARIDAEYPDLKKGDRRSQANPRSADPWIVALAKVENAKVICSERPRPAAQTLKKIPDVCGKEGIKCINLPQLFAELGFRF